MKFLVRPVPVIDAVSDIAEVAHGERLHLAHVKGGDDLSGLLAELILVLTFDAVSEGAPGPLEAMEPL
ncbi:hypothetical protein [Deinococcus sp. GbtcB9]|uniref:hypothetical protein n=1 Tax=Deinococcus sp. GbtcB9 TaxID=2824754 RepID=UPI001C2F7EE3|nr:hypothetical protein [Deinococcus sp. GbtcB9]